MKTPSIEEMLKAGMHFGHRTSKWHPKMEVPFVIARVALDDAPGVYLTTNIVGCEVGEVDIGDRVKVKFEQQDDIFLPLFVKTA